MDDSLSRSILPDLRLDRDAGMIHQFRGDVQSGLPPARFHIYIRHPDRRNKIEIEIPENPVPGADPSDFKFHLENIFPLPEIFQLDIPDSD